MAINGSAKAEKYAVFNAVKSFRIFIKIIQNKNTVYGLDC